MARTAVRANDAFVLGFFEDIHDGTIARGPIALGEAVHKEDVDIFGAEFATKAVEVGAHAVGVTRPRFGKHGYFAAVDVLERFGNVRMAAVGIGGIEKEEAVVVAIEEQFRQAADTEIGLVRMMADADSASTHSET